jgi:hypothetical protein
MAILLYAARDRIASGYYLIPLPAFKHDAAQVFIRAEHIDEPDLVAALDHVALRDGETFLNAIPDRL